MGLKGRGDTSCLPAHWSRVRVGGWGVSPGPPQLTLPALCPHSQALSIPPPGLEAPVLQQQNICLLATHSGFQFCLLLFTEATGQVLLDQGQSPQLRKARLGCPSCTTSRLRSPTVTFCTQSSPGLPFTDIHTLAQITTTQPHTERAQLSSLVMPPPCRTVAWWSHLHISRHSPACLHKQPHSLTHIHTELLTQLLTYATTHTVTHLATSVRRKAPKLCVWYETDRQ